MADSRLLEVLSERVVVGDSAMGTQLVARGVPWSACLDELNLSQPNLVLAVHYENRAAGAEALETNTFGANRFRLEAEGHGDKVAEICAAGAKLARQAAGDDGFVLGSIGPIGRSAMGRGGSRSREEVSIAFGEQAAALADGGVDALLLETFVSMPELQCAFTACRGSADIPIFVEFSVPDRVGLDDAGEVLRTMVALASQGAAGLGGNCGFGPLHLIQAIRQLAELTDAPLSAFPNSSFPQVRDGRYVYNDAIDYFVDAAEQLADAGVALIGGCCGTTPEHIRAIAARVQGRQVAARTVSAVLPPPVERSSIAVVSDRPPLPDLLEPLGREPVLVVELDAPKDMDYHSVLTGAARLAEAGVHGISVAENPLASIRMSSIALSHLVQRTAGIPAVCHITCRDRNLLGQQSALMGASALGVNTILALTGDPISLGGLSAATAVFDTNSFGLIEMLSDLNRGRNVLGYNLAHHTEFTIGVAFDPNVRRIEGSVRRLERKIGLGATFALSQMVYEPAKATEMYEATKHLEIPILAGFMPLVSARNARFLHNEVPGMHVPEEVQERLAAVDGDRVASQAVGIALCAEWIDAALEAGAPGLYLVTPFGRVEMILELVEHIKQRTKAGRRAV